MKNLVFSAFIALALVPTSAFAVDYKTLKPAETCGLPDDTVLLAERVGANMEESVDVTSSTRIGLKLASQIKEVIKYTYEEDTEYYAARRQFINNDGYVQKFELGGKTYEIVAHYPGDNEYGLIFKTGASDSVAVIADGEIYCR